MLDEKIFAHAVTMATAFVENGDIRFQESTKEDSKVFWQIKELLPSLYLSLQFARRSIEEKLSAEGNTR